MARPTLAESKDTRADLLKVGLELLQTRGFSAFSYQDLADRLGIRKASVHYHFAGKEDLGVAVMEASIARVRRWQDDNASRELSPLTRLEAYFDYFVTVSDGGRRICPCGALSSEWEALPPRLKATTEKLLETHREWLKAVLTEGRKTGEIARNGTVEEQAQFIFAAIQGGLQTSRTQSAPGYFRAVTRQLLAAMRA